MSREPSARPAAVDPHSMAAGQAPAQASNSSALIKTLESLGAHSMEAQLRSELRASNDNLDAFMRSVRSEVKEKMAQMEEAWQAAIEEEAMVRRATAIHLETRISDLCAQSNGIRPSDAMRQKGAKPAEGLHETPESLHPTAAMTTLPESIEEEILARLDEGLQTESRLRNEFETSIVGRIDLLAKRVEELADRVLAPPERTGEDHAFMDRRKSPARVRDASVSMFRDSSLEALPTEPTDMGDDVANESRSVRSNISRRHGTYMGQTSNIKDNHLRRPDAHEIQVSRIELQTPRPRRISSAPTKPEGPDLMASKPEVCTPLNGFLPEAIFCNPAAPSWHSPGLASPTRARRL